ncbi:hypothetical protein R2O95_14325, partial [Faecalibacterium duncaniae]|nr:hypothetical protein [Faecalibacterium duncaniae]
VSLATLAMGNVAFLLYDRALHNLLQVYQLVWRPKLHKMLGKRCLPPVDTKRRATRVTAVRVTRRGIIEKFGGCFSG